MKQKYKTTEKRITEEVIREIIKIEKEQGLTAENLVNSAKNRKSPLYRFFEWDNEKAGNQWRLFQARMLINEVKIVVDNEVMYGYENVVIKTKEGTERRYKPVYEIMSNGLRNITINSEKARTFLKFRNSAITRIKK